MATRLMAQPRPTIGSRTREADAVDAKIAGVLLLGLGDLFLTAIMRGASIAPDNDYSAAAISDLGVIAQTATLFNTTLVAIGVLDLVGGYFFYRQHGSLAIFATFVLGAIGRSAPGSSR